MPKRGGFSRLRRRGWSFGGHMPTFRSTILLGSSASYVMHHSPCRRPNRHRPRPPPSLCSHNRSAPPFGTARRADAKQLVLGPETTFERDPTAADAIEVGIQCGRKMARRTDRHGNRDISGIAAGRWFLQWRDDDGRWSVQDDPRLQQRTRSRSLDCADTTAALTLDCRAAT
jgi:hypothetical protein